MVLSYISALLYDPSDIEPQDARVQPIVPIYRVFKNVKNEIRRGVCFKTFE